MLYFSCKKCGDSVGIQSQFIGNVRCHKCNYLIEGKGKAVPRFKTWRYECDTCGLSISFEGVRTTNVSCVKCNKVLEELPEAIAL